MSIEGIKLSLSRDLGDTLLFGSSNKKMNFLLDVAQITARDNVANRIIIFTNNRDYICKKLDKKIKNIYVLECIPGTSLKEIELMLVRFKKNLKVVIFDDVISGTPSNVFDINGMIQTHKHFNKQNFNAFYCLDTQAKTNFSGNLRKLFLVLDNSFLLLDKPKKKGLVSTINRLIFKSDNTILKIVSSKKLKKQKINFIQK